MVRKKAPRQKRLLTEVELELMQALWDKGEATVKEVQEALTKARPLAYTSVATVMKILEKKHFVTSVKTERAHVYRPLVSREDYEAKSVRHMVDHLFRGTPAALVMRLLDDTGLSRDEIAALRKLLQERLDK